MVQKARFTSARLFSDYILSKTFEGHTRKCEMKIKQFRITVPSF